MVARPGPNARHLTHPGPKAGKRPERVTITQEVTRWTHLGHGPDQSVVVTNGDPWVIQMAFQSLALRAPWAQQSADTALLVSTRLVRLARRSDAIAGPPVSRGYFPEEAEPPTGPLSPM
jgi:hypothetical protein